MAYRYGDALSVTAHVPVIPQCDLGNTGPPLACPGRFATVWPIAALCNYFLKPNRFPAPLLAVERNLAFTVAGSFDAGYVQAGARSNTAMPDPFSVYSIESKGKTV